MPMPQIQYIIKNWQVAITAIKVTQTIVDYESVLIETPISFKGTIQPLSIKQLMLYPEGQRDRKWLDVHTLTNLSLDNNDRIIYKGTRYKIMAVNDYQINAYYEYHLCQDDE